MKYTIIALLALFSPIGTFAQKHNLFADVGYSPGFSVTYDHKFVKWLGVEAGAQEYKIYRPETGVRKFTPTAFAGVRFHIRTEKNNQFFSFLDLGINFYKQDKAYRRDSTSIYHIRHNNGFYSGFGLGYFRRITNRGGGPYASLKMIANWYTIYGYSIVSERDIGLLSANGSFVLSLGFKF